MKRTLSKIYRVAAVLIGGIVLLANSANPPDARTGAPGEGTCAGTCHSGGNQSGSLELLGLPDVIKADTTYELTFRVNSSDSITG